MRYIKLFESFSKVIQGQLINEITWTEFEDLQTEYNIAFDNRDIEHIKKLFVKDGSIVYEKSDTHFLIDINIKKELVLSVIILKIEDGYFVTSYGYTLNGESDDEDKYYICDGLHGLSRLATLVNESIEMNKD